MAPATRRSSGFGSHANSPSNLDHILEHFNQFKRKHITQNRDIIKTNALAQLRIKELEEKVLGLEAEKTQIELERHRMKAKLERAEKAIVCIRQGWQFIGAGITAFASIDGFENVTEEKHDSPSSALQSLQHHQLQAHIRPSVRVVLDPNALPAGVARNVARPPEADLADLPEEDSMAMMENESIFQPISDQHIDQQDQITLEQEDNDEDADSDQGEFGDAISFAGDGEETVRLQTNLSEAMCDNPTTLDENLSILQSQSDTREQSNFRLGQSSSLHGQKNRGIQRMTSMDSLSSFADDEEIELSTDDERESEIVPPNRAPTPVNYGSVKTSNGTIRARTPRKRKTPSSPDDSRGFPASTSESYSTINSHQHGLISASQSEAEIDEEDEENSSNSSNGIRASRRSSMRDKKSINYALPKLNTKMRKPDPAELIPAVGGSQKKKRQGSMQTGMNDEDESEMNGEDAEIEEQPKRRTLKGKNEAASTGNLREIRKLHQEKAQNDQSLSPNQKREEEEAEPEPEPETNSHSDFTKGKEEQQNHSPRRRSSRQSLRRRSSSSMTSENGGSIKADQALKSDEGKFQREESSSPEDRKVVQRKENQIEHTLPSSQKPRQSTSKSSLPTNGTTSTPKWRSMSGGMSHSSSSSSLGLGMNGNGTPIPKPTIRNGQQGTIKALNKAAGRIQKPTSSASGLANTNPAQQQQQQQKRIAAAFSNGTRATSDAQNGKFDSQKKILGSSVKANSTARSVSGSSAVSSAASSNVNGTVSQSTAGDPMKRNSLHAAMTWNEISSASQQS